MSDLRHAFRAAAAAPGFALAAIVSLALGIGANTAIFSLWKSAAHDSLPGVADPDRLVILTNPNALGQWRGSWSSTADGPRSWVTFEEFELLRDQTTAFSSLMATQSSLSTWPVRVESGRQEDVVGRLVSGQFFQVLGVRAAAGRLFSRRDDAVETAEAVISDAFWHRRFGGRATAIGTLLHFGDVTVTIVGVAPPGFSGETNGQRPPDVWLPLRLQPRVMPGADFLHDQPPDKVMWLHVLGRLQPGVTLAQAEAQANLVFRASLETFYGDVPANRRSESLDQHLRVSSASRGVSSTVNQFSGSLAVLMTAVGILLLIACGNLANLLLVRSAARRGEMAIRVALGASRGRLVRQLVIESLTLAAAAGIPAVFVAFPLHGALVTMLQQADAWFAVSFATDPGVLAFTTATTLITGLAVGLIPALQMSGSDAAPQLTDGHRGVIGSRAELRSGRALVAIQLALALPLLVGAGLLVQTMFNLQHPDIGFSPARLISARINLGEAAADANHRDRVLRDIQERLQATPGVDAATFSQLGLFSGGMSNAAVTVEGSALTQARPRDSALDRVGSGYFGTMGIPLLSGRDIASTDGADSRRVAIVNQAFVRYFLNGRNPLGLRITTGTLPDNATSYEVVGVAADARIQSLRGDVEPRFFVPAEQRESGSVSRTFLIRTRGEVASVAAAVRQIVSSVDTALTVSEIAPVEQHLAEFTAEDRAVARLALVFGLVAVLLAAAGLYGVLSYSVTRRAGEIAVRIALGAPSLRVVGMIVRDSFGVVLTGMAAGGVLAYFATRLIASRLYEVAPQDPATLVGAVIGLLGVAALAAYLPARHASRVEPIRALHQF